MNIPLTKGKVATVSDEDADLAMYKWTAHSMGYAYRQIGTKGKNQQCLLLHRVILERIVGRPLQKGECCDHINRDRSDNRRENLRLVTQQENIWNRGINKNNSSGHTGVRFFKRDQVWQARITINSKEHHLGYFKAIDDAIEAYEDAAHHARHKH